MIGPVAQLWRYPVKSMRGERLSSTDVVATYGIPGDRGWAVRDESIGEIRGAKKIGALVQLAARYLEAPSGASTPTVEIALGDGTTVTSDAPDVAEVLSARLDRPVTLWPRRPAEDLDHYRRVELPDETEFRRQLGLLPDEPTPDWTTMAPPELMTELIEYVGPRGTYFDSFQLHVLTTTSIATLAAATPGASMDVRRFRPNVLVDTGDEPGGFPEIDWCGRHLRIGSAVAEVVQPMSRCVMVTLPQDDLPTERRILRTLVRETKMDFGIGLDIVEPGRINQGDVVELL